jgi:hypothetical protein
MTRCSAPMGIHHSHESLIACRACTPRKVEDFLPPNRPLWFVGSVKTSGPVRKGLTWLLGVVALSLGTVVIAGERVYRWRPSRKRPQ